MNYIFAFGSSDVFFMNYTHFQNIFNEIRGIYKKIDSRNEEIIHESELKIHQKWNLKTYFYIRQSEIVKDFEGKLT